uniref:Uncharacterized protein n=1 Tax=Meloidogyne floridensis TaxID=298350 RepID=A0A915NKX1_9BILA
MFDFLKSNKDEKIQQQKEIIEAHEETIKKLNEKIKLLEEDKQKQLDLVTEQHVKEINDFRAIQKYFLQLFFSHFTSFFSQFGRTLALEYLTITGIMKPV